jgi:hypothetical protein
MHPLIHMHHPRSLLWPSYKFASPLSLNVVRFAKLGIVIKHTIFMYNDIDLGARQHIFLLNCGIFTTVSFICARSARKMPVYRKRKSGLAT